MTIGSLIEAEPGFGHGKGHPTPPGHAYGLEKQALADGLYTLDISGISIENHATTSQDTTQTPVVLADGSLLSTEVRSGSITIDSICGQTALHLVTDDASGRLRVNDQFTPDQQIRLGDLDHFSFDYFVANSTRTDVTPVIRIAIDADGDLGTTNDRGELVFEYAYQGQGAVPTGSWQHVDLTQWNAWQRSNGVNHDVAADTVPLSTWESASGYTPAGGIHFDQNSVVLGWSVALGSGNGATDAYVDHLQVGRVSYDFV